MVLSKGHAAPALYSVLLELGLISEADIGGAGEPHFKLQSHPEAASLLAAGALCGRVGIDFGLTAARWGDVERIAEIAGTSFRHLSTYSCAMAGEDPSFVSELLSNPLVREAIRLYLKVCGGLAESNDAGIDTLLRELQQRLAGPGLIDPRDAYAAFYRALDALENA